MTEHLELISSCNLCSLPTSLVSIYPVDCNAILSCLSFIMIYFCLLYVPDSDVSCFAQYYTVFQRSVVLCSVV